MADDSIEKDQGITEIDPQLIPSQIKAYHGLRKIHSLLFKTVRFWQCACLLNRDWIMPLGLTEKIIRKKH